MIKTIDYFVNITKGGDIPDNVAQEKVQRYLEIVPERILNWSQVDEIYAYKDNLQMIQDIKSSKEFNLPEEGFTSDTLGVYIQRVKDWSRYLYFTDDENSGNIFYHEFGHSILAIQNSKEWQAIWEMDWKNKPHSLPIEEAWAESLVAYYLGRVDRMYEGGYSICIDFFSPEFKETRDYLELVGF